MAHTVPLVLPLVTGLDLAKESSLGDRDLRVALNVDYAVDGRIQGRPSRAAPLDFAQATSNASYAADAAFNTLGFTPRGLVKLRDFTGERPALGTEGRLFANEPTRWTDRGPFHCTRVDRSANYSQSNASAASRREAAAPDFGVASTFASGGNRHVRFDLRTTTGAHSRYVEVDTGVGTLNAFQASAGAKCGTTTAIVGVTDDGTLHFVYRTNGGDTVTRATLATDAREPDMDGDAACITSDGTNFYVAYMTTTTDQVKVLKVGLTGTVAATYTGTAIATDVAGIWVDASVGTRVLLGVSHADGLLFRKITSSTMAFDADVTDTATDACLDVVCAWDTATSFWWAARRGDMVGDGDIVIGKVDSLASTTTTYTKELFGGGAFTEASIRWGIAHQPITLNGRTYLTLIAATNRGYTGTWTTLDVTNMLTTVQRTPMFGAPMLAAQGVSETAYPHPQPGTAWAIAGGWEFPSNEWTSFDATIDDTTGAWVSRGVNRVTMSGPRSAQAQAGTVFSGSIPYHVAGGQAHELGFPFLGGLPDASATVSNGGSCDPASYDVAAVWRWTDEAGQIHRSAPTPARTVTTAAPNNTISVVVTNPQLTTHAGAVIEIYASGPNPTADDSLYLQQVGAVDTTAAYSSFSIATTPVTSTEPLYTYSDEFSVVPAGADGGLAAVGRRLFVATGGVVYASKLLIQGYAPEFTDADQMRINVPAGAGRVVALEGLDDKLVIFCERGVYALQAGGPDNTGQGPDFAYPEKLSDLGIAGPRSSCSTDRGVLFCSPLDATDPMRGGPWLLDRNLTLTERQYLGRQAADFFVSESDWVPEVAWSPERQQAYITTNQVGGSTTGVVVIDLRVGKFAVWDMRDATWGATRSIECADGILWTLNNEPAPFNGAPGSDAEGGNYAMTIKTADLPADGKDGLGWSRVRAVNVLGTRSSGAHTLTYTAELDGVRTLTTSDSIAAPSASTTWPTNRQAPEWRLPSQKCSTIAVQLSATPANAQWAAIRLDVAPMPGRAPAKDRT